jgi:hypothetical protein
MRSVLSPTITAWQRVTAAATAAAAAAATAAARLSPQHYTDIQADAAQTGMQRHAEDAEACRRCRGMQKMQRHAEDAAEACRRCRG